MVIYLFWMKEARMDDDFMDKFEHQIDPDDPLYIIGIVSEMVQIPIWTLRKLDDMGIVCPERKNEKTRCYTLSQIKTLNYICYLMEKKDVNNAVPWRR